MGIFQIIGYLALFVLVIFMGCWINLTILFNVYSKADVYNIDKTSLSEKIFICILLAIFALTVRLPFDILYSINKMPTLTLKEYGSVLGFFGTILFFLTDSNLFNDSNSSKAHNPEVYTLISSRITKYCGIWLAAFGLLLQIIRDHSS